ncbi:MAG: hypothetical protein A2293_16560 [Elusimicrobia bacterium RIFOXYB2_FULL_49_7]|nr:MAG: hypothetical protein A2293_16560 [Elusimicrobia bacterium RIFOXYB2_FULL_49_7]
MNSKMLSVIVLLKLSLFVYSVPNFIAYQGLFLDSSGVGQAIQDSIQFNIYNLPIGGSELWHEKHFVSTKNGVFTIALGTKKNLPDELSGQDSLFMEIVRGGSCSGRIRITSSFFALKSHYSDSTKVAKRAIWADSAYYTWPLSNVDSAVYAGSAKRADTAEVSYLSLRTDTASIAKSCFLADSAVGAMRAISADSARTTSWAEFAQRTDSAEYARFADTARITKMSDSAKYCREQYWKEKDGNCFIVNRRIGIGTDSAEKDVEIRGDLLISNPVGDAQSYIKAKNNPALLFQVTKDPLFESRVKIAYANNGLYFNLWDSLGANEIPGVVIFRQSGTVVEAKGVVKATGFKVGNVSLSVPDFVFGDDYALMNLDSLRSFIECNRHLPNIPSEKEIEKEGIDLTEMNLKLLEKVEELTLYIIKQDERLRKLEKRTK